MIYTGYYAKFKVYKELGIEPIAISGKRPDFYEGLYYSDFAPRYWTYQRWKDKDITNEGYTIEYKAYLNTLDKKEIAKDFDAYKSTEKDCVLLCYEKPCDFCHRHVLADWIEENFGIPVKEYEV